MTPAELAQIEQRAAGGARRETVARCVAAFQKIMREQYTVTCRDPRCHDCTAVVRVVLEAALPPVARDPREEQP